MLRALAILTSAWLCGAALGGVTDLNGELSHPLDDIVGPGNTARLSADTKTLWHGTTSSADVDLNGFNLEINTGDGNAQTYRGAFTGPGSLTIVGRHDAGWWQSGDVRLSGQDANTPTQVTIRRGSVNLDKPAGVDVLAGAITLGDSSESNRVILVWNADDQIHDAASVATAATAFELLMQGHSDTMGSLDLHARGQLDLGDGPSRVRFADSSGADWGDDGSLIIRNWQGAEVNEVSFGQDEAGLTAGQVARVGFIDPAGFEPGLYRARILDDGQVIPHGEVKPVDPPFDLSATAQAERERLYVVDGRANLTGKDTPLAENTTISVFGDSITWQDGYLSLMRTALDAGAGTRDKNIRVVNRGINGGGVLQVRDGSKDAAYPGSSEQESFAEVIAADQSDIAVVFIGINDLWWRNTSEADYRSALQDLVEQAKDAGTTLVFASPTVRFEMPDGSNDNDQAIDRFTQIMRAVAEDNGVVFVDLRSAYIAYLQNHNRSLQLDGSLVYKPSGVLTYDGVHPTAAGNELLAELISQGIYRAAAEVDTTCGAVPSNGSLTCAVRIQQIHGSLQRSPSPASTYFDSPADFALSSRFDCRVYGRITP